MEHLFIPAGYKPATSIKETEGAIKHVKDHFERQLAKQLNLTRVSAPLFVKPESGLNDNLNGVERPVSFGVKELNDEKVEIVHSLAKWKRMALKKYGFSYGEGLYTDMNAIRRDEDTDNIHSIFVDQWDWETLTSRVEDDFLLANFNDYPWDLEGISSDATREVSLIESLILKSGVYSAEWDWEALGKRLEKDFVLGNLALTNVDLSNYTEDSIPVRSLLLE